MRKTMLAGAALLLMASLSACEFSSGTNRDDDESAGSGEREAEDEQTRRFVNSMENARSADLREHYVDFEFDYPERWTISPQPSNGTAENFVRVAAPLVDGMEPFAFHVGTAYGTGNADTDRATFEQLIPQISQQAGAGFDNYRVVSTGEENVGEYESIGWRFEATAPGSDGEPVPIYGRADIVLPPGEVNGVFLISFVSERSDEFESPEDVGESGTLEEIFDSLEIG